MNTCNGKKHEWLKQFEQASLGSLTHFLLAGWNFPLMNTSLIDTNVMKFIKKECSSSKGFKFRCLRLNNADKPQARTGSNW